MKKHRNIFIINFLNTNRLHVISFIHLNDLTSILHVNMRYVTITIRCYD